MPLYTCQKRNLKILFIHIPKCGGGSIERIFRLNGFKQSLFSIDPFYLSTCRCSPQHMHGELLNSLLCLDNIDYCFAIMRNPFDRLISEYRHRICHEWASCGFDEWYKKIKKSEITDPFIFDNHIRAQLMFLVNNTQVFRFEDGLELALNSVMYHLNFQLDMSKFLNQKAGIRLAQIQGQPNLIDLYNNPNPSENVKQNIRFDYRQDYDLYSLIPRSKPYKFCIH